MMKPDEVLREFPWVGKYRVRVLRVKGGTLVVDVREYIRDEKFEGFTRRGVRLDLAQTMGLAAALKQALDEWKDLEKKKQEVTS